MGRKDRLPRPSGKRLIWFLKKDGWQEARKTSHGISLTKRLEDRTRVTVVKPTNRPLPIGTLKAILGDKQTALGDNWLRGMVKKYKLS